MNEGLRSSGESSGESDALALTESLASLHDNRRAEMLRLQDQYEEGAVTPLGRCFTLPPT